MTDENEDNSQEEVEAEPKEIEAPELRVVTEGYTEKNENKDKSE